MTISPFDSEERLFERVRAFVPARLAGVLVTEALIAQAAVVGLLRRREKAPNTFGYVENSIFRVLPLIVLFCSPADVVLVHLILRIHGWLWTTILVGLDIYALVWTYGVLVTMRERPHEITDTFLYAYEGLYARAAIALDSIQSAVVAPSKSKAKDGTADLSIRGTQKVGLRLARPAQITRNLQPDSEQAFCVTISADDPAGLCRAIDRHRRDALAKDVVAA